MTRIERRIWWAIYFLIGFTLIAGVIGLIVFSIMMIFRGSILMAVISFAGGVLVMSMGRVIAEAALDPKAFMAAVCIGSLSRENQRRLPKFGSINILASIRWQ